MLLSLWCIGGKGARRLFFFFQAEDGIRDGRVTGVQTCALPICGFVADGQLVVPGGDGTVALESADAASGGVAGLVQVGVEGGRPPQRPLFLRLRTWSAFSAMVHRIPRRRR